LAFLLGLHAANGDGVSFWHERGAIMPELLKRWAALCAISVLARD
jgi:hypothetical protein